MQERRTEPASPRKLARARSRGVVVRSPELSAAAALLAIAGLLAWSGGSSIAALRALLRAGLTAAAAPDLAGPEPLAPLFAPLRDVALAFAPLLLAAAAAAFLAGFAQVGPLLSGAALAPDLQRLSPVARLRAFVSGERAAVAGFGVLKLAVVLGAALCVLAPSVRAVMALPLGGVARASLVLGALLLDFVLRMGAALAFVGTIDLVVRRVRNARDLRMSRRELDEELRESHGLPEQRAQRRRSIDEARAHAAVGGLERASVLLLDTRGRALALAFDVHDAQQHAPRVVAKGHGVTALRMQAWAEQNALPVRWHAALVSVLFRLELTEAVPGEHHPAVVEVFADLPAPSP